MTVEKVLNIASSAEITNQAASEIEKREPSDEINLIKSNRPFKSSSGSFGNKERPGFRRNEFNKVTCYSCGREGHIASSSNCPARGRRCDYCNRMNHLSNVCRLKQRDKEEEKQVQVKKKEDIRVKSLMTEDSEDEGYIFNIGDAKHVDVVLDVEGKKMGFLVDSGSWVDVMDRKSFDELKNHCSVSLNQTKSKIYAYGSKEPLKIDGVFYGNVSHKGTKHLCRFHIMTTEDSGCVIGRNTALELGLICMPYVDKGINSITESKEGMMLKNKFPTVFQGLGKLKDFQLKLNIDSSVKPVSQHLRRIPFHVRKKVETKLEQLIELDIIEPVDSTSSNSWISPVIAVPKGNDIRMVVDMRQANSAIQRSYYPVPTLEELLDEFRGCTLFSKVDLFNGYHQIELAPESREITTFITHAGIFRYKRLVQGANSAMEEYQRAIGNLFKQEPKISNIADDILIAGVNKEEHDERLMKCLEILKENHLTVNEKKCIWGVPEVTFFGHVLSESGIRPTRSKVETVKTFPKPNNRKQLSSFLGLITFLAKFVPNLSSETAPIRKLLRKDVEWKWGSEEQETFDKLKTLVTSETVLAHFDPKLETYLITDAGAVGVGAILAQKQPDETLRPVHYASRSLTNQEKKYSQTEKEGLGVVWACERFHLYLYGKPFVILTDHQPLKILYSRTGKPSPRVLRWSLRLQSYDYTVEHIPGSTNPADIFSNFPLKLDTKEEDSSNKLETYINQIIAYNTPKGITLNEVMQESERDEVLNKVRQCIGKGEWPRSPEMNPYAQMKQELMIKGGIILKDDKIVIPKGLRKRVLQISHETHQGITKTKELVKDKVWWPGMDKEIEELVRNCVPCLSMSNPDKEPLKHLDIPNTQPYEKVYIDICGPFPSGDYVLGIIDGCTRWPDAFVIKSTNSETITKCLLHTFSTHGFPSCINTDNAPNLVSVELKAFCAEYGIKHTKSLPYWPRGNAEVERFYKTLGKFIKVCTAENRKWQLEISKFLFNYRITPHCSTGIPPALYLMNRSLRSKFPTLKQESEFKPAADKRNEKIMKRNEKYFNQKRNVKESKVTVNSWVLLRQAKKNKLSTNFDPQPWKVEKIEGSKVTIKRGNQVRIRNINDLKMVPNSDDLDFLSDHLNTEESSSSEDETESSVNVRPRRERRLPSRYDDFIMNAP